MKKIHLVGSATIAGRYAWITDISGQNQKPYLGGTMVELVWLCRIEPVSAIQWKYMRKVQE